MLTSLRSAVLCVQATTFLVHLSLAPNCILIYIKSQTKEIHSSETPSIHLKNYTMLQI